MLGNRSQSAGSPPRTWRGPGPARLAPLLLLAASTASPLGAEAPPLPASLYGTVRVAGAAAEPGTTIGARFEGAVIAASTAFPLDPETAYRLDVPGDDPETAAIEGPAEGQEVELLVGGAPAALLAWTSGSHARHDLDADAGADLAVALTDDTASAAPGATLDFLVTLSNSGPGGATGVSLRVALPAGATLVEASDGGTAEGAEVFWPPFDLPESETAERSLRLALDGTFPAGVDSLTTLAQVTHDGSSGADPDPANDLASDVDLLVATPDLTAALDDGLAEARPGATLVYRAIASNFGTQGATGIALELSLPPGVDFYSASHGGFAEAGVVSWTLFDLPAGAQTERAVTVRIPSDLDAGITELLATAALADDGTNGPDPDPADNVATDLDALLHAPDLAVELVATGGTTTDPQTLAISGEVEVLVANRGTLSSPPAQLALFVDVDRDGAYDPDLDSPLGATTLPALAPASDQGVTVDVGGFLRFLGEPILAMADAAREIEEPDETNNLGSSATACAALPAPGPFAPVVERRWPPSGTTVYRPAAVDSLSTPLVVQLTDDNGDGLWNDLDVPDLVFVTVDLSYLLEPQVVLRAVRGDTLAPIFDVDGVFPHPTAPSLLSFSGLAAGDIDQDGKPEILSTTFGPAAVNVVRAYEHTGAPKWVSQPFHTHPSPVGLSNRDNPTLADLDGDGEVEILVGAHVFDRFGHLRWVGTGGQGFQSSGNSGDRGGAISVAADLDLDGRREVVAGNTAYRHDGSVVWQSPLPDGYAAVADFDGDPQPEVVVVAAGTVRLHDADGALLWGPVELPGSDPEAGGAPTLGDFDGDGAPEIGVAGSDVYVVLDGDGTLLWQASTQDHTSNLTGSTSFDFDGDGALEIVYRDERRLRIYRGSDGALLFETTISSNTWTEEPVVADVDRDGDAEIVVTSDRAPDVAIPPGERTSGLFVFGDAGDGWISARPLWHQHAYTPEQVEADGGIPAAPAWGWLEHNSFRANVPALGDPGAVPDLTASRVVLDLGALPALGVTVRIGNAGRTPVGPDLAVAFYDGEPQAGGALLGVVPVGGWLEAGAFVDLAATLPLPNPSSGLLTVVADDDGSGSGRERECDEANNRVSAPLDTSALGLWLTLDDGTSSVGAGDEVTYAIAVRNAFAGTATGVLLTDSMPAHTEFVAASDGGAETGGMVSWPPFALPPGGSALRTLTLRVDPAIPLDVTSIVNQATVVDDGAQGPDPTPENNVATDVDAVTSVTADAGGPYSGPEGLPLALDGSGSFDRDGTIVDYAWDLDGDGAFDDAAEPTPAWLFPGEGSYTIRLRVTDDSGQSDDDSASVEIGNEPPVVVAPPALEGFEGTPLSLASVGASDPGDELEATVDWGDGTTEPAELVDGALAASHVYLDDGAFEVEVCIADGSAPAVCATIPAAIANAPPVVRDRAGFLFEGWSAEELGGGATTSWSVSTGGGSATELLNGEPTLLVGELPAYGTHEILLRVASASDDDFVGLALGVEPGSFADPAASWLLVDWKRGTQSGAVPGLALSRVFGVPDTYELWLHIDHAGNGPEDGLEELARATNLGAVGWARHTDYRFRIEYGPSRLRIWVDGTLELDLAGDFPAGRLGLYDYSQAGAVFTALDSEVAVIGYEGEPAPLRAPFSDPGSADTHLASIDWGDGVVEPAMLSEEEGLGEVAMAHVYVDDSSLAAELCIVDDDGGEGCATIPVQIRNRPPDLALSIQTTGFREDAVSLEGTTFTDPGAGDLHTATVDWGDGVVEPAAVVESGGAGSLAATHRYAAPGSHEVEVCVEDDDGGVDCETASVAVVDRILDLAVAKRGDVTSARPGQPVTFTLDVENQGSLPASGVVLRDLLPEQVAFVGASDGGTLAGDEVLWDLGALAPGEARQRSVVVQVDGAAPFGATLVNTAEVADDGASGPDGDLGDNSASATLRVSDAVTPIVELPAGFDLGEGALLTLGGATWNDTAASENHTGTVDWGDGASGPVTLTPARGTAGSISAEHIYLEDGDYLVTVCVRDAAAHVGCATALVRVANLAPDVLEPGVVGLDTWRVEEYDYGDGPHANWIVAADGLSVRQTINSRPSIFLSPLPAYGLALEGSIRVGANWDDDFVGFVLGFEPGDSVNPEADYLLIDWKQAHQTGARRGLAVSRLSGLPVGGEFWNHSGNMVELARGLTLGNLGWRDLQEYRFRFEYSPTRLRVWVDDVLQFDLEGDFPDGNFGFFNYSQQDVTYRGFAVGLEQRFEGETFELRAPFVDPGVLDTHVARIAWDDGAVEEAVASATQGFGFAAADHLYPDDGDFLVEACVEDDEGEDDCGRFPLLVLNRPPEVAAAPAAVAVAGAPWTGQLATFTDPGRLDSHLATVDWGDGSAGTATIVEDDGAGTVSGGHVWLLPGSYPVTVCVIDDDGGEGCDSLVVEVLVTPPALAAEKRATPIDLDGDGLTGPGDRILYRIEIFNRGVTDATGVALTDPIPAHTAVVPGSSSPELLIVSEDPLVAAIPHIEPGASIAVQFAVTVDSPLPAGVAEIVNQGLVESVELPALPTDDPLLPGPADPTRTPVDAAVELALAKSATLVDRDGDGVATPGDAIEWRLDLLAGGDRDAGGIVLTDPLPAHTVLDPGSVATTRGAVAGLDPLIVAIGPLGAGEAATVRFRTTIDPALPPEIEQISNQASLTANELDLLRSDDPATPALADPTSVPVYVHPTLMVAAAATLEGSSGATPLPFALQLDRPARLPLAVDWSLEGITALPGEDFVAASGTATFAPGDAEAIVAVEVLGDPVVEPDETLRLVLSNPVLLELGTAEALGTILNDDATSLLLADPSATEGDALEFSVALSAPSALPVAVDWQTADGSATAGLDYVAAAGQLLFAPMQTSSSVSVLTLDDADLEDDETVRLLFSAPAGADLPDPEALGAIVDDDQECLLACPTNLLLPNDPGLCAAPVELPLPSTQGACGLVSCEPPSGALFPVGTTTVLCTAELLPASCTFEVTVADVEPPALAGCPADFAIEMPPGALSWPVDYVEPEATDNCPDPTAACQPASGELFLPGATRVVCTAVDGAGLAATCDFEVRLEAAPIAEIPALSPRALALFALLLALAAWAALARRHRRRAPLDAGNPEGR